ncbi:MAG: acyl-CoA/acyl-ACP dehydrogenase [Chloroflexi bacterium]|nr:acyl-CoA/acyl-ACP dehydrogenase [Chloroflexota bacterium]
MYREDPEYGRIVDFDWLRTIHRRVADNFHPRFNMLGAVRTCIELTTSEPSVNIAIGASLLAYTLLIASDEDELAESLKDAIFTLAWTEEHCGSDLLSLRTHATPIAGDETGRQYHLRGSKWIINNSIHADYHIVLAKLDPTQDGPRSLSFFLVPHSSTKNWQRMDTHVLRNMVLAAYEIDGPGRLLGKVGHGLSIVQRMATASRYLCSYMGVVWMRQSLPAAIEHLACKHIFGAHPLEFGNVFRQMYVLVQKAALLDYLFHRSVAFNDGSFLQFLGTMLKSWLLLRTNEVMIETLLVTGSKGFVSSSPIGRNAIDSLVLPVFDGHYTVNTNMSAKHLKRYLSAARRVDLRERLRILDERLYYETYHEEIHAHPRDIRKPDFFDFADYLQQFQLPLELDARRLVATAQQVQEAIIDRGQQNDPEHRYKAGDLLHWLESILVAAELSAQLGGDYVNAVAIQYNGTVELLNQIIAESALPVDFMTPARFLPLPRVADPQAYLLRLLDVERRVLAKESGVSLN